MGLKSCLSQGGPVQITKKGHGLSEKGQKSGEIGQKCGKKGALF